MKLETYCGKNFALTEPTNYEACTSCPWLGIAYNRAKRKKYPPAITRVDLKSICKGIEGTEYRLTVILATTPPLEEVNGVPIYKGVVPCPGAQNEAD